MEYSNYLVYINGDFVPRSDAKLGLNDRGFRLGDLVYDTERTIDGRVYQLRMSTFNCIFYPMGIV